MNTILAIYGHTAFKRFLLPSISDADYTIRLGKELYNLPRSIAVKMDAVNGEWSFAPSDDYDLLMHDGRSVTRRELTPTLSQLVSRGNHTLRLMVGSEHVGSVHIRFTDCTFSQYEHYSLSSVRRVSIGRLPNNDITVGKTNESMLSGYHASLIYRDSQWYAQDENSSNGTFLNNRRIYSPTALSYGDCIDLFGIRIIYLGNEIAINVLESDARVSTGTLLRCRPVANKLEPPNKKSLDHIAHRSPRQLMRLDTSTIKIDAPPAPKDEVQRVSILTAIGSSAVMALPMLLGCAFMFIASNMQGVSRGAFMFVGLITSVCSAVIGAVRTVLAMRRARREYEAYEAMRHEKYRQYLAEREQTIAAIYAHNTEVLRSRYLPASVVVGYMYNDSSLWGKNVSQPDFLTHRIGTGELPFQASVQIPEHRFTLVDNDLATTPDVIQKRYAMLRDVPICVDLMQDRLVGIVGGKWSEDGVGIARALVSQIAATNSYTEVKLVFVYDEARGGPVDQWEYVRWLPHVWNETRTMRYVASNENEAREVFYEINRIVRERSSDDGPSVPERAGALPHYVIVLAAPAMLEGEILAESILRPREAYGLSTIYLAERYEDLPNECELVLQNDREFRGVYRVTDNLDERVPVLFDRVDLSEAERQAAELARTRILETQQGGDIPQTVSFLELYGAQRPDQLDVLKNWRKNRTYESMRAVIGQKAGGQPCYLDIHEKYHGPHGLVAGTTGSGKSETLQTFILSLAISFSPDDVSFFVIDYKGGGMASLLTGLPHLIGQISNLSGNQVNRALVSIQSEKNRREAIFKDYGVKDIRDYTKLVKSGEAPLPVPHLIIVIDEFAEMKHDEPEFIAEVVSLSRVGRSLGIHLIMATQRPSGAVSEDIWANSRFKLCLRVQSKQDSTDMLHKPDAAFLTQSGRCYLQVGNDELFELFQSGYSGAVYTGDGTDQDESIATMLSGNGTPSLVGSYARIQGQRKRKRAWIEALIEVARKSGLNSQSSLASCSHERLEELANGLYAHLESAGLDYPKSEFNTEALVTLLAQIGRYGFDVDTILAMDDVPGNKVRLPQQPERTQLDAVIGYLQSTATSNGFTRDYSLFLPLLPSSLALHDLPLDFEGASGEVFDGKSWRKNGKRATLAVGLGLYDDPFNQRQDTYMVDLIKDGNLAVYGAPQMGKSSVLQSLVYALVTHYTPQEINVYAIEYSARKFGLFQQMPHVGGVVSDNDDLDKLDKLFHLLMRLLDQRKRLLGESSFVQYMSAHGVEPLPAVLLVIDNYASLVQRTSDKYAPLLRNILKEGIGYGMFVAVSAAGVGGGELPMSLSQSFRTIICLELPNEYDYGSYLRRSHVHVRPESETPGRCVAMVGDRPLEVQIALPLAGPNASRIGKGAKLLAQAMDRTWRGRRAEPIPMIPENPTWDLFAKLPSMRGMLDDYRLLPFGYDAKTAEPYCIDLTCINAFCITGSKKTGKTNALRMVAMAAKAKGGRVVFVDYSGESSGFARSQGMEYIQNEQEFSSFICDFMPQISKRNQRKAELVTSGITADEVFSGMQEFEQVYVLIDDLPSFVERAYRPSAPLQKTFSDYMTTVLDRCIQHNIYWFGTIDKSHMGSTGVTDMYKVFVHEGQGVHFGGKARSTALPGFSFENHNTRTIEDARPAGRAMIPYNNEAEALEVVVPLAQGGMS